MAYFCAAPWAENGFCILKQLFKQISNGNSNNKEYGTQNICAPQSLKYLLPDCSLKKIADPALQDSLLLTLVWKYQKNSTFSK